MLCFFGIWIQKRKQSKSVKTEAKERRMTYDSEVLDAIGWELLRYLQEDARVSFAELGRRLKLSAPAITERVRRLEDAGIITGYRAVVDPARIGLGLTVFFRIQMPPGNYPKFSQIRT
jgi:Lrp/AsnC family leucine-responsive transcriptional regulator